MTKSGISALLVTTCLHAFAGEANVLNVEVSCSNDVTCSFAVSVEHDDDGWNHYADKWEVLSSDGEVIATRELAHPHDNEQPFTRSLTNVKIPAGVKAVVVRAHDSIHEFGGKELVVKLPR